MIKHIVLLAFSPNIASDKIKQVLEKLGDLRHTALPQIKSFSYGKNSSPEQLDYGFNYGFIMEFANQNDRAIYLNSELHQQIAKNEVLPLLKNGIKSVVVFDYQV